MIKEKDLMHVAKRHYGDMRIATRLDLHLVTIIPAAISRNTQNATSNTLREHSYAIWKRTYGELYDELVKAEANVIRYNGFAPKWLEDLVFSTSFAAFAGAKESEKEVDKKRTL